MDDRFLFKLQVTYDRALHWEHWNLYWFGKPVNLQDFGIFNDPETLEIYATYLTSEVFLGFLFPERKSAIDRINRVLNDR